MAFIEISNITKDYGSGRGNFGINLSIKKGEVIGFVGTNGSGKTTLIRQLMGFLRPQKGSIKMNGLDAWTQADEVKGLIGYVPGEISFPPAPTGSAFLKQQAELLDIKDMKIANEIIKKLQLDPTANLKRMSKGMKQKTAIAAAFMADPQILILDEPTTGLDPLMRAEFVRLIHAEKAKGKTIFMSSHMFEEVEDTCDRIILIKDGQLLAEKSMLEIRHNQEKVYKVEFVDPEEYRRFVGEALNFTEQHKEKNQVFVKVNGKEINRFLPILKNYQPKYITEIKYSLEQYFKSLY